MEAEGGINEKNSCKAAAMLKHCFMKDIKKVCLTKTFHFLVATYMMKVG